jgi:hypothetical protein
VFDLGKPFQFSLIFAVKAGAYPSEAPLQVLLSTVAPGLTHKHWARLERLAKDKHSSLLQKSINYGRKFFIVQASD